MLSELNRPFLNPNCEIMMGIQALKPSSATFCLEEELSLFMKHRWPKTWTSKMKIILERKVQAGIQNPTSVVDLTVLTESFKEVFHKLFRLCKIAVAIPVSKAACELCFSTLNLVKSYLRSTLIDFRLSN